ncbi:MAG: transposase [Sulfuricaulis sp.]|uniref:REP-associated tyrosine transposase n=1 Tax=Sulfuricaulis sp. TaxID=2003553 RepID=UPI0034A25CC2
MRYRRAGVPGASYFFTVNLAERSRTLLVDRADILREVIREVQSRHPFRIDAMVALPDHLHAIWTLPKNDKDFSTRWMLIKSGFSRRLSAGERRSRSRLAKGERGVWQRRFWEHLIRDEKDYERHVDYIHYNPVKHGYVARPVDWAHSSIHRFIAQGIVSPDWAVGNQDEASKEYGER